MQIEQQRQGAVTVVKPQGPLTEQDAPALRNHLREALTESLGRFVVDASGIPFVDSAGLEALVDASEEMNKSGLALKFCSVPETIAQVFSLTGLSDHFEQYEDVNSAIRSFL
jgi:anti-anti-sigma factor